MVRFSCFQYLIHSPKQKKTIKSPAEAMQKTLEYTSQNWADKDIYHTSLKNDNRLMEEAETLFNVTDQAIDSSSPTECDGRLEELKSQHRTGYCVEARKDAQIRKSQSLGSGLIWIERKSCGDCSECEVEQKFSCNGSADGGALVISDGFNDHVLNLSEHCQEKTPSDSAVNSDFAKNASIFCIGDSQELEVQGNDKNGCFSNATGGHTPQSRTPLKGSSLPNMASSDWQLESILHCSRSAGNLNDLDSERKGVPIYGDGIQVENVGSDYSIMNNDRDGDRNSPDKTYERCNYVGSAKDWIIPVSEEVNMEKSKSESSFHWWDEVPSKDLMLKRIEDWVFDLQHCSPLESNEFSLSNDHDLPESYTLLEESTLAKLDVKVNPGMVAANRYISSMNTSATAAQLANFELAVIPFLSPFISLRALNLSGNSIVKITAGALPRGLQILNFSKNNITTIEGLRDLTRLRVIDLSFNRILRIGHGLAFCSSLKELYLAGNKISEVEGLHRLLKLNVLDLRFNKISTTKCLGQLAANHSCLQALSLEGNPAQKNVGDEQLKKYVQSLLPHLACYNRQTIKVGVMKDITSDRSARLGISGLRTEVKNVRKGTHGIIAQKTTSSSIHGRRHQAICSQKSSRIKPGRLAPLGAKAYQGPHVDFSRKHLRSTNNMTISRTRSEGTLGAP